MLSFPFLYLFERGNILLLTFVLVLIFLVFGDSPSRTRRELALLALAAAAALKLYPAIFALFLLRDKRYRELGRVILYFLLLSVLPTFFFGGRPRRFFGASPVGVAALTGFSCGIESLGSSIIVSVSYGKFRDGTGSRTALPDLLMSRY